MKRKFYLFKLGNLILNSIFLFSISIELGFSLQLDGKDLIFSREPIVKLSFSNNDQILAMQSSSEYLYLSINQKGIQVYSWQTKQKISDLSISNISNVPIFFINQKNTFLFTIINNKIMSFSILSTTNNQILNLSLVEIKSANQEVNSVVPKILVDQNDSHLFIYGGTQVAVFDALTLSKLDLVELGEIITQMRFSFDGNYLYLLSINANQFYIRIFQLTKDQTLKEIGKTALISNLDDFEITQDKMWIYGIDQSNQMILIANIGPIYLNQNQITIIPSWKSFWPFNIVSPIFVSYKITNDDKYFMVGIRSIGIIILEITDKMNPKFYYQISFSETPKYFEFNGNLQNYFAISDSSTLMLFKGQLLNLNENIPNFFNRHQEKLISIPSPRRCQQVNQGNNILISQQTQGLSLLQFYNPLTPNQVKSSAKIQQANTSYWDFAFDAQTQTVYTISTSNPINLLDFLQLDFGDQTSSPQITLISQVKQKNSNLSQQFLINVQRNKDGKLLLQTFGNGFILFDSADYPNLKLLAQSIIMPSIVHQADITKDNQWVICTQRETGFYGIVDISDYNNITLKNLWRTSGVEGVITSQFGNYAYLYNGSKGITILDTSVFPNIKVLSNVKTKGWTSYITLFSNEDFLIASTLSTDLAILIDIRDKKNPIIISKLQDGQEKGYSTCLSVDEQTLFILNDSGMRSIPIKTKTQIHFQLNLYDKIKQTYFEIENNSSLLVGQSYVIHFTPLYFLEGQIILDVLYYNNYVQQPLPYWMSFSYIDNSLFINASKEGLDYSIGQQTGIKQNTVLIKVQRPILQIDFIFDLTLTGIQTTSDQSLDIFYQLKKQGLVVKDNYAALSFFEQVTILQINMSGFTSSQLSLLADLVKNVLLQSVQFLPFNFFIEQSIKLDFTSQENIIQTSSPSATITFTVNQGYGQFVRKLYSGVMSSSNESQSILKLEGQIQNLNQVLQEKILFFKIKELDQIIMKVEIDDKVNYLESQNVLLSDSRRVQFIQLKTPISLKIPLQQQLENLYPSGILYIETSTNIEFNINTFLVSEPFGIEYSIFIQSNDDSELKDNQNTQNLNYEQLNQFKLGYRLLPDYHWLKFDNIKLKLSGYAIKSLYNNRYTYKIIASDGFTKSEDTFSVVVSGIPVGFILLLIFEVLGPLFSLIGIYMYRSTIYNFMYHQKIGSLYEERICINQLYVKKIAIIGNELIKAQKLLESIIAVMRNNKDQIFFLGQRSSSNLSQSFIQEDLANKRKTIDQKNIYFQNQLCNNVEISNSGNLDNQKKLNEKQRQIIIRDFIETVQAQLEIDSSYKKQLQIEESKRYSQAQIKGNILSRKLSLWLIQKKIISFFTDTVLRTVSTEKIWTFLQKHKVCYIYNEQTYTPQHYGVYLQDPTSVFYYCFLSCISSFLLKMDNISFLAYNALIKLMQTHYKKDKKKWYDRYVKATIQYSTNYEISTSPFPEVEFNEKLFRSDIEQFFKEEIPNYESEKLSKLKTQVMQNINFSIIKEVILSEKLGILNRKQNMFEKQFTEYSLHAKPFLIDSIQCLKDEPAQNCYKIRKCLHMNKQNYTLQKNTNFLPNWMKLDIRNANCVILYGVPSFYEQEELQVRIYDKEQFIICQFDLKIIHPPNIPSKEQINSNLKLFHLHNSFSAQRQRNQSCYSPLQIRLNQQQLLEENYRKPTISRELTEENLLQQSQQLIVRTRSIFQKQQNNKSATLYTESKSEDMIDEGKRTTIFNTNITNSPEEEEDNCSNQKEEDQPIYMYSSKQKKTKSKEDIMSI